MSHKTPKEYVRCAACGFAAPQDRWVSYRCPKCGEIHDALYCRERHPPAILSRSEIEAEIAEAEAEG